MSKDDLNEFISEGTKTAFDLATGDKNFDEATAYAKDKTRSKIADKVADKIAPPVSRELVKFSDAALEQSYKVSYEISDVVLPPKVSQEVGRQLRISTDRIKAKYADNLNAAAVEIVTSSTKTIFDVATGDKNFGEAREEIFAKTKVTVKNVVIEESRKLAVNEAQRIGREFAGKTARKILLPAGANANAAVEMIVLGNKMKDSVLKLLDGEIDLEQYIFEMNRACVALAIKAIEQQSLKIGQGAIPIPVVGALIGSAVISVACRGLMIAADAALTKMEDGVRYVKGMWKSADNQAAADRRKAISKIKTDALAEMDNQRGVMKKYFADEKFHWDKNVQDGFKLITSGAYSNDAEVIAQGLDKILRNFGGQVAFSSYEEFDDFFMDDNAVLKL